MKTKRIYNLQKRKLTYSVVKLTNKIRAINRAHGFYTEVMRSNFVN